MEVKDSRRERNPPQRPDFLSLKWVTGKLCHSWKERGFCLILFDIVFLYVAFLCWNSLCSLGWPWTANLPASILECLNCRHTPPYLAPHLISLPITACSTWFYNLYFIPVQIPRKDCVCLLKKNLLFIFSFSLHVFSEQISTGYMISLLVLFSICISPSPSLPPLLRQSCSITQTDRDITV